MSTAEITERTEKEVVVILGQESTTSSTITHFQLETACSIDEESYLLDEADRRGVSLRMVRHEEDLDDIRAMEKAKASGPATSYDAFRAELGL
jgi:hypothetical protein